MAWGMHGVAHVINPFVVESVEETMWTTSEDQAGKQCMPPDRLFRVDQIRRGRKVSSLDASTQVYQTKFIEFLDVISFDHTKYETWDHRNLQVQKLRLKVGAARAILQIKAKHWACSNRPSH